MPLVLLLLGLAHAGASPDNNPLRLPLPPAGTVHYEVSDRSEMDRMGVELLGRSVQLLRVEEHGSGRRFTATDQLQQRVVQTDFGLAKPEVLASLPDAGPGLSWVVDRRGKVSESAALDAADPQAALMATLIAAVGFPSPPLGLRPGEVWTVDRVLPLEISKDGVELRLQLTLSAEGTFLGWETLGDRAVALLEIAARIELSGVGYASTGRALGVGAVGRAASLVWLDPADGLPVQATRETWMTLASDGRDRVEVVHALQRITRLSPPVP